jgi:CheY-like chemotaxis protein
MASDARTNRLRGLTPNHQMARPLDLVRTTTNFMEQANVSSLGPLTGQDVSDEGDSTLFARRRGEILLIDDRSEVRTGIAQLLELHGFMVTEAADADHGMRELAEKPTAFALVVLDLMLGESMSGIDFRLRQLIDPRLAAVPTIVITATDVAAADRSSLHPEGWLEKPFRFDTLLEIVRRYVIAERGSGLIGSD